MKEWESIKEGKRERHEKESKREKREREKSEQELNLGLRWVALHRSAEATNINEMIRNKREKRETEPGAVVMRCAFEWFRWHCLILLTDTPTNKTTTRPVSTNATPMHEETMDLRQWS